MLSFTKVLVAYSYNQALADGYSTEQAATYGVLIGASEGTLQYLLGGISKLGGVSSQQLLTKISGIENGLLRAAAALGIKGLSEVTEEELQLLLEPLYRSIVSGEDYDAPTVEEMVYTAIISFMMTGVIESGEIAGYAHKRPASAEGFDFSQDDSWFGAAEPSVDPDGDMGYDYTEFEKQVLPDLSSKTTQSKPYDLQPTHSPTLSKTKMNALADDLKTNGIREPIKCVEFDGQLYVVDGHHRLLIAKRLGLTEIPVEIVELPYSGYSTVDDLLWFD